MAATRNEQKLLVVQAAALGDGLLRRCGRAEWNGMTFRAMDSVFPALTCPVQASFRTASTPGEHGMIANGLFSRAMRRPFFWEQSSGQVGGARIWDAFRRAGRTVALLFWQQSLGESVDCVVSPAPIHKHHGGMIQDCYSRPEGLYGALRQALRRPFVLRHYWGPLASVKSSQWIADATCRLMLDERQAPDLCLTYLPALDYDLQRYGPNHAKGLRAADVLFEQLDQLYTTAVREGYQFLVFGDYAIGACPQGAVRPNRALYEAGLLRVRKVRGMLYPDFHESRAFAVVDHEIAHVYLKDPADADPVGVVLSGLAGVGSVMGPEAQREAGVRHANTGDWLLTAAPGRWFAYSWWRQAAEAPDYAAHVDIHSKPGYDPCELFFGWPPGSVSLRTDRIMGSHGLVEPERRACWASTFLDRRPGSLVELAACVRDWLTEEK